MLVLALLITFSASGLTISIHSCCDSASSFSIFGNAESCTACKRKLTENCSITESKKLKVCCSNQQVPFSPSIEKTSPAIAKTKDRKAKDSFNVLFFYTLFQNWFNSEEKNGNERLSPGLVISKALILLFQQFRI